MDVPTPDNSDGRDQMGRLIDSAKDRASLERLRDIYTRRLHRQSDDFDATYGLRLVIARLQRTFYGPTVVTRRS